MDAPTVTEKDIGSRKKIGKIGDKDAWLLETKGGFCLVAALSNKGVDVLGCGQHPGIAKFMAEKQHPDLRITELAKSEETLSRREMAKLLPEARKVYAAMQILKTKNAT